MNLRARLTPDSNGFAEEEPDNTTRAQNFAPASGWPVQPGPNFAVVTTSG